MIVSAAYTEDGKTVAVTLDDDVGTVMFVPDDPMNRHRVELEEWAMVKGNIIEPYEPPDTPAPKRKSK